MSKLLSPPTGHLGAERKPREPELNQQSLLNFGFIVRIAGVVILLFGISVAFKVVEKAWILLDNHQEVIIPLSEQIAKHSPTSSILNSPLTKTLLAQVSSGAGIQEEDIKNLLGSSQSKAKKSGMSYYSAWGIVIVLLSLIAKIATSLIKVGGTMAAAGYQRKENEKLLRSLVSEMKKNAR